MGGRGELFSLDLLRTLRISWAVCCGVFPRGFTSAISCFISDLSELSSVVARLRASTDACPQSVPESYNFFMLVVL